MCFITCGFWERGVHNKTFRVWKSKRDKELLVFYWSLRYLIWRWHGMFFVSGKIISFCTLRHELFKRRQSKRLCKVNNEVWWKMFKNTLMGCFTPDQEFDENLEWLSWVVTHPADKPVESSQLCLNSNSLKNIFQKKNTICLMISPSSKKTRLRYDKTFYFSFSRALSLYQNRNITTFQSY